MKLTERNALRTQLALVLAFGAPAMMAATPPTIINYQGVLRSASDAPPTGNTTWSSDSGAPMSEEARF
jgi:hypothetical protein